MQRAMGTSWRRPAALVMGLALLGSMAGLTACESESPEVPATGCETDDECPDGERCAAGRCEADDGRCGCPEVLVPVCGTDGLTYGNACEADCAGVQVARAGDCSENVCECPAVYDPVCGRDGMTYDNACRATCAEAGIDYLGECLPDCVCPPGVDPVCGVDGRTYDNACEAGCAGVGIASRGRCGQCDCPDVVEPVCGRDGADYENACLADCLGGGVAQQGECPPPCECPDVLEPVCGADGLTYDNACRAACAEVEVARPGDCADAPGCAGEEGGVCGDEDWCDHADNGCGFNRVSGVCTPRPEACPDDEAPICGCDDVTYPNACAASAAGIDIQYPGVCVPGCSICAGTNEPVCGANGQTYGSDCVAGCAGIEVVAVGPCQALACNPEQACPEGQFCAYAGAACGADGVSGVCTPGPPSCDDVLAPVCGCDGVSYPNACEAQSAGAAIEADGACPDARECAAAECGPPPGIPNSRCPDGTIAGPTGRCLADADGVCGWEILECPDEPVEPVDCGARLGDTCGVEGFCDFAAAGCDFADATGICRARPDECPLVIEPVCACDGQTYDNACLAHRAGVDVDTEGACGGGPVEPGDCAPDDCGPPPGLPNVECADGTIGGPTGRCLAEGGRCAWEIRACPGACLANDDCPVDRYCARPAGACEAEGICQPRPDACDPVFEPVCGCNERSYGNVCSAARAGTSVAYDGDCIIE